MHGVSSPTRHLELDRLGVAEMLFQMEEVQTVLAARFRASDRRVVAGVSTGGYGAFAHAARHRGTFAAAASDSGLLGSAFVGVPAAVEAVVARVGLVPWSLWGSLLLSFASWQDCNPQARAAGLSGTPLYVSCGSGVPGVGGPLLPAVLESVLRPAPRSFVDVARRRGIPVTSHLCSGARANGPIGAGGSPSPGRGWLVRSDSRLDAAPSFAGAAWWARW